MPLVEPHVLTAVLLRTEREINELGPDQPDLLFAVRGPRRTPQLQYLLQLPGSPADRLGELLAVGARIQDEALGLALVASAGPYFDDQDVRAAVCVLRDGTSVAIARGTAEEPRVVQELPTPVGSEVTALVARLLVGDGELDDTEGAAIA